MEEKSIQFQSYEQLKAVTVLKTSQIIQWKKEEFEAADVLSRSFLFNKEFEQLLAGENNPELKNDIINWFRTFKQLSGYKNVFISTSDGKLFISDDPSFKSIDSESSVNIKQTIKNKKVLISDIYKSGIGKQYYIDIIAPIMNCNDLPVAVIVLRVDPDDFLFSLIQSLPLPSKTFETLILRKEGDNILYLNELRHAKNSSMNLKISLIMKENPGVKAVQGYNGFYEGTDYRGITVLTYINPIPGTSWFIESKVDKDEIFSIFQKRTLIIIALVSMLILLSCVGLFWVYHFRQKNIYKDLFITEKNLREKEEEFRITLYSIGDAVITTGINGHIKNMNHAAEKLAGWKESDAAGKKLEDVFRIVNEETRLKIKNPVENVLHNGKAVGLTNHTLLILKNGKEIPISNSGAPIKNGLDQITGVVSIFRDQTKEREAERKLVQSEEQFRLIFERSAIGKALVLPNGNFSKVNHAFAEMLGYPIDEILNLNFADLTHPDDAAESWECIRSLLEDGKSVYRMEKRYLHKDGSIILTDVNSTLLRDENNNPKHFVTSIQDITQRKQSEELLRESEEKYRILSESSPEIIYLVDLNGYVTYINNTGAAQFKVDPSDIIGKHVLDIFPSDIAVPQLAIIQNVIQTKSPFYREIEVQFPTGSKWIGTRVSPIYNKENKVVSVLGLSVDISEQKLAENELLKLSHAVEQGPASVVITNRDGIIEFVNQKFSEISGYTKEEAIGKNPRILSSGHHDKKFYEELWNTLLSGNNWNGEILNKKKNGESYWESALISPLIDNKGEITHFVAVKEDITEKKNMIFELIKAKEVAESANKLKDAFIANMSHEIRTPLNGMLGMTNLIREIFPGKIREEDEELFVGIDHSSQRIIRTVDMILNYSRLQVGEFPIYIKKLNLSSICKNLIREYVTSAKHKSLELTFNNNCDDTEIFADEYSITMAISNLIDNAIKYSEKGFIIVSLSTGTNNEIILKVKDTGIGINEKYLEHIFDPYRQEQMGYGRAYDGIGLGLSLVKKVLILNKAKINVESKKGEGTTFSIIFGKEVQLFDKVDDNNIIVKNARSFEEPGKGIVLIVEDDALNQLTIKRFIGDRYSTLATDSSEGAIEILKSKKVEMILMDISIRGDKNGLEFTKELKASKEFSHIPVIAITAHAFEEDKQMAFDSGCDNYLAKPFTKELLLEMIADHSVKSKSR